VRSKRDPRSTVRSPSTADAIGVKRLPPQAQQVVSLARLELPQSQSANVELVQQGADDPPRPARHGPVNNRRSAAREHD